MSERGQLNEPTANVCRTTTAPRSSIAGPAWYAGVLAKYKGSRSDIITLERIKSLHQKAKEAVLSNRPADEFIRSIRDMLEQLIVAAFVTKPAIKRSGILTNRSLHSIFDIAYFDGVAYPTDMQDDAFLIYQKWFSGDVEGDLLRGIKSTKRSKETKTFRSHAIEPKYVFRKSANFVGNQNGTEQLKNGMWWGWQVCAVRDGVHGEIEAGISGQKSHGAYSVVMSRKGYANRDHGDIIEYCGTPTEPGASHPSGGTSLLLESEKKGQVIRVLRSAALNNKYAPAQGIRYDGLYKIASHEVLDASKHMHRFIMNREPGQTPIRFEGEGARPSTHELNKYYQVQDLMSGKANN